MSALTGMRIRGSSPLARGLRLHGVVLPHVERIIPARAGFTWNQAVTTWTANGSSPLARGLLHVVPHVFNAGRIIPARAGFTTPRPPASPAAADHPRSRGVYPNAALQVVRNLGSSPLARGLLECRVGRGQRLRIIPARAGFTSWSTTPTRRTTDHPRSRGVYFMSAFTGMRIRGSSPLARGLRRRHHGWRRIHRDHPRSRGVYPLK